jgi:cold-inducible RNA-binding protein
MPSKIYVGNLSFNSTEHTVRDLFAQYGEVTSVNLITDRDTGRPRGFGFVEMDSAGASAAINALNDTEFEGRTLTVNEAKPRESRGGGGGGGGGGRRDRW